jgi:ribose-phosphate pyrophosphokinase
MWNAVQGISRPDTPVLLFCQHPFTSLLGSSNLRRLRYAWVWEKTQATGFLNARRMPMKAHEDILVDHLYASAVFLPYIESLKLEDLVIATPDVGGSKRASTFSKYLGVPLVLCNKTREKANVVATMQIIGDVKDKNVVLVDDIVDTAGTITKAANIMLEAGAKSVRAIASHCVMSDPASFRVQESALTEMVFTDSIPYSKKCDKVKQLSIADMFAETIKRVMNNESISSQYII